MKIEYKIVYTKLFTGSKKFSEDYYPAGIVLATGLLLAWSPFINRDFFIFGGWLIIFFLPWLLPGLVRINGY